MRLLHMSVKMLAALPCFDEHIAARILGHGKQVIGSTALFISRRPDEAGEQLRSFQLFAGSGPHSGYDGNGF